MRQPREKCVVDTNVPVTANMAARTAAIEDDLVNCVLECVKAIRRVMRDGGMVIDHDGDIFREYLQNLSLDPKEPGVGNVFAKWVHDTWDDRYIERIAITPDGDTYQEFPKHDGLTNLDPSDRKFVAVANAHPDKPPILEATDSKWWGWREALAEVGITVQFLCPTYAQTKYREKMEQ